MLHNYDKMEEQDIDFVIDFAEYVRGVFRGGARGA